MFPGRKSDGKNRPPRTGLGGDASCREPIFCFLTGYYSVEIIAKFTRLLLEDIAERFVFTFGVNENSPLGVEVRSDRGSALAGFASRIFRRIGVRGSDFLTWHLGRQCRLTIGFDILLSYLKH